MKQKEFQTTINKNFNHIPDSLINFSDVNECKFLADKLSFMGYGQNTEGYFGHKNVPNPSQRFHLEQAFFAVKFDNAEITSIRNSLKTANFMALDALS